VRVVAPGDTVAAAARVMAKVPCGALPVVDEDEVLGLVTDRDICLALAERDRPAGEIEVWQVCRDDVVTCRPEDDVRHALAVMRARRVRRLPVVEGGSLVGIVSLDDAVRVAIPSPGSGAGGPYDADVVLTLGAICRRRAAPA
jgi:CBS domain-containing protein